MNFRDKQKIETFIVIINIQKNIHMIGSYFGGIVSLRYIAPGEVNCTIHWMLPYEVATTDNLDNPGDPDTI